MSDKGKAGMGGKRAKDVSPEDDLLKTGDQRAFAINKTNHGPNDSDGFAQPKGIQTRAAIANHLAKKLKIANKDLTTLMKFESQLRANDETQDTFWQVKLRKEREKLEATRRE